MTDTERKPCDYYVPMEHIRTIHHGCWTTVIEGDLRMRRPYRITTFSGLHDTEIRTFVDSWPQSKRAVANHMEQVRALREGD